MNHELVHPRDQITLIMQRVYRNGMTTTSGGNLSVRETNGDLWITPAGVDKGALAWEDVVQVHPDGTAEGAHRPSSELPFHQAIYQVRPDIGGIVHAHPAALVSYSIVRKTPPTRVIPQAREVCGRVGCAPYALPGSAQLGRNIAHAFSQGFDCVLMENHGAVCGGRTLLEAFHRFETLDFCARLVLKATMLGPYRQLSDEQIALFSHTRHHLPEFDPAERTSQEKALRRHLCEITHRAYDQQLMTSTEGVVSGRLDGDSFLITPTGKDRRLIDVADAVLIRNGHRERGKWPSRSVLIHQRIYREHPDIRAIVTAQAPHAMAFAVGQGAFDTRTIPESYLLLRNIPRIPFGPQSEVEEEISRKLSSKAPVLLLENDALLTTGVDLLQAYDRLEVAEFSAESLLDAALLGGAVIMDDSRIKELEAHFFGKD